MALILKWLESMHVDLKITSGCSRKRNLRSTCKQCIEVCQYEALAINQQQIEIKTERCTSCGNCIISCPLSAIRGVVPFRDKESDSLLYRESYTPLVKEFLIYKKRGIKSIQTNHLPLNEYWREVLSEANRILLLLGQGPIETIQEGKDEKISRRAFLSSFQEEGKQFAKRITPAAWHITTEEWNMPSYYQDYQFYTVIIDQSKCTLCKACFSLCSESVFTLTDSQLQINHQKCVNCSSCTDICTESAIQVISDIKQKSETNENLLIRECEVCRKLFHSINKDVGQCHICYNRNSEWLSPHE